MDKTKSPNPKGLTTPVVSSPRTAAPALPVAPVPPLFRPIDWLTFSITWLVVMAGYYWTLATNLGLEDSGELAVGSFYAGIPHPPGYPVWTIYTYFWSHLPFGNVAGRVALGEAFAGAVACGLLGLIVSRGSSMLMEGIEELKVMTGKWEAAICVVSGFVAGGLLGFNGFMWSQSVIVEVYSFGVLSLVLVMLFLLRWMYAPEQKRYLYWAFFMFGICFTNHQSLLVAAMGIEVAIIVARPALGRDFLFINSLVYLIGWVAKVSGRLPNFDSLPGQTNMMFVIFNLVGLASIVGCGWLFVRTQKMLTEWKPVLIAGLFFIIGVSFYLYMPVAGMSNPPMQWGYPRTEEGFWHALTRGQYEKASPTNFLNDPGRLVTQLGMLAEGVADEFSWVFMFIALVPFLFLRRMKNRERAWLIGVTAIYLCLGVLLMILINPPPDRAARELVRVFFTASHVCVALLVGYGLTLITAYMATHYDQFRRWGLIGGAVAFALALVALAAKTEEMFGGIANQGYFNVFFGGIAQAFAPKQYGLPIFAGLLLMGVTTVFIVSMLVYRSRAPLTITLALFVTMPGYSFMKNWFENEQRGHLFGYWFGHDMFTPPFTAPDGKFSYDPKLRAELMKDPEKAKLIYPEMTRNAILYGGTDPGRFCPTYTIFCESFIPPECKKDTDPLYDRRDVYIITQNALADGTYLMYIRAHYNKSDQIKYDSPFFQELLRSERESKENYKTNFVARLAGQLLDKPFTALGDYIEKQRRAGSSFFKEKDFIGDFASKLRDQGDPLSKYLYENLTPATQKLISDKADSQSVNRALAADLNVLLERELVLGKQLAEKRGEKLALEDEFMGSQPSERQTRKLEALKKEIEELSKQGPLYEPGRFAQVQVSDYLKAFIRQDPKSHTRIRLNRMLLEEAYPSLIAKSPGGVYPDREMLIATPEDSQHCFQQYLEDAQRRLKLNQLKPGEGVQLVGEGPDQRVQVSGQVAVMSINGLLTKVMFDKNPENEFFVEESFPLDWMYDYLTPFGIIMKINRNPLPELSEDILVRDHEFWSKYTERLIGNWITYDTPVKDIVKFAEKLYLKRDFSGYNGDLKFARDDQAQKAFSKLRSSIGGVYAWRVSQATQNVLSLQDQLRRAPAQNQAALQAQLAHWSAVRERMIKETDFAFRQAFAFCPYSPEAVFRYCQLLISLQRYEDAYLIAETCRKLDPYNAQVVDLVQRLSSARAPGATSALPPAPTLANLTQLEAEVTKNPADFQKVFNLAATYLSLNQTNRAIEVLDGVLNHPQVSSQAILALAQAYISIGNYPKLETTLEKLVKLSPSQPEAWYDLAALKAQLQKPAEVIPNLRQALALSAARLKSDPNQKDLRVEASNDWRFGTVHQSPEFQALLASP